MVLQDYIFAFSLPHLPNRAIEQLMCQAIQKPERVSHSAFRRPKDPSSAIMGQITRKKTVFG
jgi:hypothetical protein